MVPNSQQLHWTQRVALVRHNLHVASRSGDWCFFKTLQAAGFMEGTNHVATLATELGDDADIVTVAMDNLNAGLAYVHEDAFKNVYENLKNNVREEDNKQIDKSKLYVDITMQRNMADMAIDKMASSALALIHQQPEMAQDSAANVWITGSTIVADCMEVALKQMDELEEKLDDFIRLEDGWNTVKASVVCAVMGLKGVFRLMDLSHTQESPRVSGRSSSIASASGAVFRRFSSAFVFPTAAPSTRSSSIESSNSGTNARNNSVSSMGPVYRTPNYMRKSVSDGCPTSMPPSSNFPGPHKLSMIPPTPAAAEDAELDPFDSSIPPVPGFPAMPLPTMNMQQRMVGLPMM